MKITERELEDICCAIMKYKTSDGKYTLWGSQRAADIFNEFVKTGRVIFETYPDVEKP